ncbi:MULTISPECIES: MBL fold metallo-hydrolase RNA specificity domain-containing protein [Dictyoglomus]|jgi:metallo-beta-lactamase family protein|uniref:Beta-lactamase domain protein n=1 Tax=Dictyoglomus turgidum (strain DSM 6724 / Z-1310) TaxID=515635 RepID=B8E1Z0_DICTD|nr:MULTISPECIES: MBL fold metallo-hydrolase [Dictyoglomus]ACK41773.1 beta-lactamase domain protein [Dictyoglomus turgidum DSM 6724]PNV79107.1 MAG: MBL fold metallo-hydrolase [Dictyoglomus turgidum]HBU31547.1 MBL fold metallo-hydrolase [Dictyoglomus sp.]
MRITFYGAAGEVTGSCYLLENNFKYLVDCGIFQGRSEKENENPFLFDPTEIKAVILTHAHLDHSGRIPKLVKEGFKGRIYATYPTIELCEILWLDTVKLMKEETERINRKNLRSGKPLVEPLYTEKEVEMAMKLFEPVPYDEMVDLSDIKIRFRDSAHILGASSLELWSNDTKIVFSGDIGPQNNVMEGRPSIIEDADYVVIESTYGDRLHKTLEETRAEFEKVVLDAINSQGKILIPSFVVDRAQRVMYELMLLSYKYPFFSKIPIFFDSPMGKKVTAVYEKHSNLLSGEIQKYFLEGINPFELKNLRYLTTPDESKSINELDTGIIIAGSGMCTGGRILHHLKHNLWKENTHVIFVGYQAQGTLGRRIVDGEKVVHVMGEEITVRAKIHTINGFSAHADQKDLIKWTEYFKNDPIFLIVHGEPQASQALSQLLQLKGRKTIVPSYTQSLDLEKKEIIAPKVAPSFDIESLLDELSSYITQLKASPILQDLENYSLLKSALHLLKEVSDRSKNL